MLYVCVVESYDTDGTTFVANYIFDAEDFNDAQGIGKELASADNEVLIETVVAEDFIARQGYVFEMQVA